MIDPEMPRITEVNQAVGAAPGIGMNNGFNADTPTNNGLERFSLDIRDHFGKDFAVSFADSEDDSFTRRSATAFAFDTRCAKVRLINLDLTGKR